MLLIFPNGIPLAFEVFHGEKKLEVVYRFVVVLGRNCLAGTGR